MYDNPFAPPPLPAPPPKQNGGQAVLVLIVLLVFIAGFTWLLSTTDKKAPTVTQSNAPTAKVYASVPAGVEDRYLSVVRPEFPNTSRATLLELGHTACDVVAAYHGDVDAFMHKVAEEVDNPHQAGTVIGAAIPAFCPEYNDALSAAVNE